MILIVNDVVDPNDKVKLRYKLTNNPNSYASGKGELLAPFELFDSSVDSGYASNLPLMGKTPRRFSLEGYHNDFYGDDKEIPAQGPFTEKYVGGWDYRHVPFPNTNCSPATGSLATGSLAKQCRPEAWNLNTQENFINTKSFEWTSPLGPTTGKVIEISDTSALRSRSGSWTVSLWFKNNYAGGTFLSRINNVGAWPSVGADWQLLIHGSGQIWFAIFDDKRLRIYTNVKCQSLSY